MPSKSNANPSISKSGTNSAQTWDSGAGPRSHELRASSLALSATIHASIAALGAIILWQTSRTEAPKPVEIQVIENPKPAPLQVRSAPKPEERKEAKKPRAVFGLSRKAIQNESGPEVKAGNTVAKAPDQEKLKPNDADSLPIPTEEYLVTKMPELVGDIRVPYPPEAKKKGVQGAVVFDLLIDDQGGVRDATFISGPGAGLNEAAAEAVRKLKFRPAQVENKPVSVRIRYAYRFVLER